MNAHEQDPARPLEERLLGRVGACTGWALLVLLGVIVAQVVLRYGFNHPVAALSELQRHLYALLVMVAISYASAEKAHVRVDLFHDRFPARVRHIVAVITQWFLLAPLAAFILHGGLQFAMNSFRIGETSPIPGGLPFRWIVKALIPLGALLVLASAVGEGWRAARRAMRRD